MPPLMVLSLLMPPPDTVGGSVLWPHQGSPERNQQDRAALRDTERRPGHHLGGGHGQRHVCSSASGKVVQGIKFRQLN